ncbi:hypothetical protein TWF730_003364 [Orbilia blumenaviensis]|uniref:Uncharacterized protein n=1 Tax=Orbilia blumenaviensis TaxID=1796055 RepID=A0AAV9U8L5_9PEZI
MKIWGKRARRGESRPEAKKKTHSCSMQQMPGISLSNILANACTPITPCRLFSPKPENFQLMDKAHFGGRE